jgi:8-hydroxy-5-deazaflavin:NADPH oxidoreductase
VSGADLTVVEREFTLSTSDSAPVSTEIAAVAERLGSSPVELGRIDEGGLLIQARNSLVLRLFVEPMF